MSKNKLNRIKIGLAATLLVGTNFAFLSSLASATPLTTTYLRETRMKSGQVAGLRLQFKAASSQTANVTIDMNGSDTGTSQWTNATPGGLVAASQTPTTAACATDTGDTALPTATSLTAAGSGSVITISGVSATTSGTTYCVDLSAAVTNPTAGHEGEYHPKITIGTDSTYVSVDVIANDQVTVNATVPPTFNLAIGGCASNTDNFGTLASGSVNSSGGCTVTVNTNAKTGWLAWVSDSNTGLKSAQNSNYTIPAASSPGSAATIASGTEGYVFGVTSITQGSGAGTTSSPSAYDSSVSGHGSGLDSTARVFASSTGTASSAVVNVKEQATISSLTPAGTDYTDTLTITGAGNF